MPRRILVVDDNEMNLYLLTKILELEGYQVIVGHDGAEAIQLAEQNMPDMALLDVMMPDINGYDLCRKIRQLPFGKEVPIVMLTAMSTEGELAEALEAGATDIWSKPFDMNMFRQRIGEMVKKD